MVFPFSRFSLCSFLHRIVNHPILKNDHNVHEFLELENELPRYFSAQPLSGAGAIKLLKNVGEVVGKLTFRMDELDEVCTRDIFASCEYSVTFFSVFRPKR